MESGNLHIVAITLCIGVVIFSFFALGLDKIVVKPLVAKESKTTINPVVSESQQPEPAIIIEEIVKESPSQEIQYVQKKSDNTVQKITTSKENKITSKIKQFEKDHFTFYGTGTFYRGSPMMQKRVSMSLNLKPIVGTSLEKFEISSGKIVLDSLGVTITQGHLSFEKNNQITLSFLTSYDSKTTCVINGKYQETILSDKDKEINIAFTKQSLQLSPKIKVPFIIDISGNITH